MAIAEWGTVIPWDSFAYRPDGLLDVCLVRAKYRDGITYELFAGDIIWGSVSEFQLEKDHHAYHGLTDAVPDMVNHPPHYTAHPSGVECIQITEHMNFCIGSAMKYLWRYENKGGLEDLQKAVFYISREIERLEKDDA